MTLHHALVGEERNVRGELDGADTIAPASLPNCDLLIMDCEGSEIGILRGLDDAPDRVVVETHGCFGASTDAVVEQLETDAYDVRSVVPENREKDICIVTATQI